MRSSDFVEDQGVRDRAYLFCTPSISVLGGAERYIAGKAKWLNSHGWDVFVAGPIPSPPEVDYGSAKLIPVDDFNIRPSALCERVKKGITKDIIESVSGYSRVFIESSSIDYSFWGEYLASKLNASHLIFHLGETIPSFSKGEQSYLVDKLNHSELFFISGELAKQIDINCDASRAKLAAYMPKAIQDCNCSTEVYMQKLGIRIGCISRIDKPFLLRAVRDIRCFAEANPGMEIELIVIGGASSVSKETEEQKKLLDASCGSFRIIFTGAMYPIPNELVQTFDFGIGKAGGAWSLAGAGVVTATYSLDSDLPMGVLGFECSGNICEAQGTPRSLVDLLDNAFVKHIYRMYSADPFRFSNDLSYEQHFRAFRESESSCEHRCGCGFPTIKDLTKGVLRSALGRHGYCLMKKLISRKK